VIGRLHFEDLSTPTRRGLLEVAYASGEPLGVTLVIHETIRTLLGQVDGSGPEDASKLLRLLAGGEDSRVYPLLAFVMKSEDLTEEARPKLVEALQEVGLWGDVSRVMGSFKGHWPLVAPAGVEFDQFAGKVAELEGIDAKNEQAVDAFMEKARAHWQEVHREELGYYRTKDGDVAGPVEQKLMRQFSPARPRTSSRASRTRVASRPGSTATARSGCGPRSGRSRVAGPSPRSSWSGWTGPPEGPWRGSACAGRSSRGRSARSASTWPRERSAGRAPRW
jgi:Fe-S-cluster formation regulator IscX/YfhJ